MDPDDEEGLSRRSLFQLAGGAAALTILSRKSHAAPIPRARFIDSEIVERIDARDPSLHPPLLIDIQTHVWWRANGGIRKMTDSARAFLENLAGTRARVTGNPVPVADMGRCMFVDDMFLRSETDIAFLNAFGMRAQFDGIDAFAPREAAHVRSMAPARIRVHGTVDPPDGPAAVESVIYQCEALKIDSLKLYPPGGLINDAPFWRLDDKKRSYPVLEAARKHGVKNVCVHTGYLGYDNLRAKKLTPEEEECLRAPMIARVAADFPDLNFIAFHATYPWEEEFAEVARKAKVKNMYCELGGLAKLMWKDPQRYTKLLAMMIDAMGADHILWGSDTPIWGPPQWQVQFFQALKIPDEIIEKYPRSHLTTEVKNKILGLNTARLYNVDVKVAQRDVQADLLYKLRADGNTLPGVMAPLKTSPSPSKGGA
jgi:predicted TIM-barrel fold metal-dependent hydrolase